MHDLGALGAPYSNALAVNSAGTEIVGYAGDQVPHAFLYSRGSMKDLNRLIPRDSGWTLSLATGVDDTGLIAGYGLHDGSQRAFLLVPRRTRSLVP